MYGFKGKIIVQKYFVFVLLNIISVQLCFANYTKDEWKKLVVKVSSFPCDSLDPVFEGTGLIVKSSDQIRVLTSEHVLYPGDTENICHRVSNSFIGKRNVKLKTRDFSYGLAELLINSNELTHELEFIKRLKTEVPPSENHKILTETKKLSRQSMIALGFPKGSEDLQVLTGGQLITDKSLRAFIPKSKNLIEVSQLPVEFGMSGGVLLSDDDGEWDFEGMLSHQYLKRKPSTPTQALNINEDSDIDQTDIAIAIKASEILSWQNSNTKSDFDQWIRSQGEDQNLMMGFGPLNFKVVQFIAEDMTQGGADGSGIGGNSFLKANADTLLGIEITLNSNFKYGTKYKSKNPLIQQWYELLLRGETLTIIQMIKDTEQRALSIQSFDQLITLWERDGFKPLVFRGNISSFDISFKKKVDKLRDLQTTINKLRSQELPLNLTLWLNHLNERIILVENLMIEVAEIKKFQDQNQNLIWNHLYLINFDLALELNIKLERLLNE